MSALVRSLKVMGACEEAVMWAKDYKTLRSAWKACKRGDWMLWLSGKMQGKKGWPTYEAIVLVACDCAELALPIYEKKYPNDKRVRNCIEVTRKWANGEATIEEVREARSAAYSAAASAGEAAAAAAASAAAAAAADAYAAYSAASAATASPSTAAVADAYAYAYAASAAAVADAYAYAYAASAASAADAYAASAAAVSFRIYNQCADICRKGLKIPVALRKS